MILAVNNLSKTYDGKDILRGISFHIEAHDKLAVTGINGAGKSTLLKQIIGEESPDSGSITIPKDARIGYLSQNMDADSEKSIYDEVISIKQDVIDMENELRSLEKAMQTDQSESLMKHYSELSHRFELENGYAVRSNVTGILKGLGFREDEFDKKVSLLSGGQKTRLALGRLLLDAPDILILDEPTNHLDIASVSWLEGYLKAWKGAVIIVSHDRYFLDRIVNKVLDIENGTATMFTGNYTAFAEKKAALRKDRMRAYLNNQAEIKHQQEVIDKLKQFNREKSIKRAESREKALAKIDRVAKPFDVDDAMKLHFTPSKLSGKNVIFAEHLSKAFGDKELFSGVELDVKRGEKLAIIGPNGTGKTTLLKIINGTEEADSGEIEYGTRVEIAYYDQEHHVLDPDNTVFDEISDAYPYMNNTEIRNLLASFLFTGDDVFKLIKDLSGGEKGRLSLAKLMLSKANLLLLDEPTNHLDITSKEILEEAVKNYEGTVIYVSHDRYFINRTATRILELDHKHFVNYQGNYDYYLEKQADASFDKEKAVSGIVSDFNAYGNKALGKTASFDGKNAVSDTDSTGAFNANFVSDECDSASVNVNGQNAGNNTNAAAEVKLSFKEQKERKQQQQKLRTALTNCEKEIEQHETAISDIDTQMADPATAVNSAKLNELSTKQAEHSAKLEELYIKWEELSEALENF